jgi:hypothetical protein
MSKNSARARDDPYPNTQHQAEPDADVSTSVYQVALANLISNLVALSIALLLLASILFVLLRRLGPGLATLRHGALVPALGSGELAILTPPAPEREQDFSPNTAQPFDLGLTYAEELRLRDQALEQQEHAILRHIFEQNVQLREQINQMETVPA